MCKCIHASGQKYNLLTDFDLLPILYFDCKKFFFKNNMSLYCRIVAVPIGRWFKLRETSPTRPVYNETLEAAFKKHKRILPPHDDIVVTITFINIVMILHTS